MIAKLLVVDDDADILYSLKRQLERNNFEVITAISGEECIAVASEQIPQLILLDIIMPSIDGYEVIKRLRADPKTKHIPVIMHSVIKETKSIFKSKDLGCIDYVMKPISFENLLKVIKKYV